MEVQFETYVQLSIHSTQKIRNHTTRLFLNYAREAYYKHKLRRTQLMRRSMNNLSPLTK